MRSLLFSALERSGSVHCDSPLLSGDFFQYLLTRDDCRQSDIPLYVFTSEQRVLSEILYHAFMYLARLVYRMVTGKLFSYF
jgi:hypothetical protein